MSIRFDYSYVKPFVSDSEMESIRPEVEESLRKTMQGTGKGSDYLGWFDWPEKYDREEYERLKKTAERLRSLSDILVVIGIGGSYLGARAAIEFCQASRKTEKKDPHRVLFAGNHLSTFALHELLEEIEGKDVCVNVISKSGTTTEPAIVFRIFKKYMEDKYGVEGAKERIVVTTDKEKGALRSLADQTGYETFVIPRNIGGRYSVLTPVGLLPIAFSGADT
ncbi:MAG: glucose-6-phosphate isomerase, partial [Clostridia bacterium]|nr:glucose-6-phosphate isomerase [Clostridia bacterium]